MRRNERLLRKLSSREHVKSAGTISKGNTQRLFWEWKRWYLIEGFTTANDATHSNCKQKPNTLDS